MKAAVFKDIETMVTETLPIPDHGDGLLVKVHACGICGSDIRNFRNGLKGGVKNQIMGHEIAGEVVAVGKNAGRFKVGDRVALAPDVSCGHCWYCKRGLVNLCVNHRMLGTHFPGGYAQYLAVPTEVLDHGFIEKIPEGMSYETAAFAETCAAVIACHNRINTSMGDTVVVIGDGPVGCIHVEVARARGAKQVVLIGRGKLKMATERFNPDYAIHGNTPPDAMVAKIMDITDGIGADIVISAVPSVDVQRTALNMVRKRGTVVIYGGAPKTADDTVLSSNLIHYSEINFTGAFSYPATGLSDALAALQAGHINAEKYINAKVSLDNIVEGMAMVKRAEALKVMIDPWME